MISKVFLEPRYVGERFCDHTIPVACLKDLIVLQEIISELAKRHVKEKNKVKRLSSDFTNSVSLHLSGISEGSTKPLLSLAVAVGLLTHQIVDAFEYAKTQFFSAISQAENDKEIDAIPQDILRKFDKFGIGLLDGEKIEFTSNKFGTFSYTQKTRGKLLQASKKPQVISKDINIKGIVSDVNTGKNIFGFTPLDGRQIYSIMPDEYFDTLREYLSQPDDCIYVSISGVGKYKDGQLSSITEIDTISELDEMDIDVQIHILSELKQGWLEEGSGEPVKNDLLSWAKEGFIIRYPNSLPIPYLYATEHGGISAEWDFDKSMVVLQTENNPKETRLHLIFKDNTTQHKHICLDMSNTEGWKILAENITAMGEYENAD